MDPSSQRRDDRGDSSATSRPQPPPPPSTPFQNPPPLLQQQRTTSFKLSEYQTNWGYVIVGTTSLAMFAIVTFGLTCCYQLMDRYMLGISCGIMLSVVNHPTCKPKENTEHAANCASLMRTHRQSWRHCAAWYRWVGTITSLHYFVLYVTMQGVHFLGLQKLNFGKLVVLRKKKNKEKRRLEDSKGGRDFLRIVSSVVLTGTATLMVGFLPWLLVHVTLLAIFIVLVWFLSDESFVYHCGRMWRITVLAFLFFGVLYSFFLDAATVTRTTTQVMDSSRLAVEGANLTTWIFDEVESKVLEDIASALNAANVTKTAHDVREAFGPILANLSFSWSFENWTSLSKNMMAAMDHVSEEDTFTAVSAMMTGIGEKWRPIFEIAGSVLHVVLINVVNIFDAIYEFVLFVFVYRFLTALPHTVVYYTLSKILGPLQPQYGALHAKHIETDITMSFRTLLQSFWHITWLHFSVTFCSFAFWDISLPFFMGVVAVAMALFPMVPKWCSPVCIMLIRLIVSEVYQGGVMSLAGHLIRDGRYLTFLVACGLVYFDEWLLSVERGLRGALASDSRGVMREQIPNFIVGTCIILGMVAYGMVGIVLGPLTVICVKTLSDNWDNVTATMFPSDEEEAVEMGGGGAFSRQRTGTPPPPTTPAGSALSSMLRKRR